MKVVLQLHLGPSIGVPHRQIQLDVQGSEPLDVPVLVHLGVVDEVVDAGQPQIAAEHQLRPVQKMEVVVVREYDCRVCEYLPSRNEYGLDGLAHS